MEKNKGGRPPKSDATKDSRYNLRLSPGEAEKLEYCCKILGLDKAEVLRHGLDEMYAKAQQKAE